MILKAEEQLLHDSIEALPVELREAIVLRELEQMDYKQIAHVCGCPIGTVMSRLHRGRRILKRELADEAVGSA